MDNKKMLRTQDLSGSIKAHYLYTRPNFFESKKEIINSIVGQIKQNPNFSLGDFSSEDTLRNSLNRKVFGDTDSGKLVDLTPHIPDISRIMETVFQKCFNTLPTKEDVTVYIIPFCNEVASKDLDGTNAFAMEENIIYFLIDVTNLNWQKGLKETIPHEYAHIIYTSYHGWNSILDGLVNEGFAEHFRRYVVGGDVAPWSTSLPKEQGLKELRSISEKRLNLFIDENNVDLYISYFFGTKDLPKWYGYCIGYWLINDILEKKSQKDSPNL